MLESARDSGSDSGCGSGRKVPLTPLCAGSIPGSPVALSGQGLQPHLAPFSYGLRGGMLNPTFINPGSIHRGRCLAFYSSPEVKQH